MVPGLERFWLDTYGAVALTGEPQRVRSDAQQLGRWFDVYAMRVDDPADHHVAIIFTDVTDQEKGQRALRDSQERLQQALSAGRGIGTWDWDVQNDLVYADARFAKLYGVDPVAASQGTAIANFFSGMHPADRAEAERAVAEAVRSGAPFSAEYRLLQPDGSIRWAAAQGQCRHDAEGRPTRFGGVSFDITERRVSEARQAAMLEVERRFRDLEDPAEIAFAGAEAAARALGVSRAGYGIIDKERETIRIDRDWNAPGVQSIAGELSFRDYGSYIDQLKRGETVAIADAREDDRTRDTAHMLEQITARAFINMPLVEHGNFVALFFVNNATVRQWHDDDLSLMRNIAGRVRAATERSRAERARRESEEQFRAFAQVVPNQIWAADVDGRLYWFNDQVFAYLGREHIGVVPDDGWAAIVHDEDREAALAAWHRSLESGRTYEVQFRMRGADGSYRWFLVRAEPVRDKGGAILRWVGTSTDIDDQLRQADALRRLNETLEEQVQARTRELMEAEAALRQSQKMEAVGQLTGGIAHDFNNLLTGITGSLEMMAMRIQQGRIADVERYSVAAQGAARRAAALTHRLLAFSRRQTLDPKPTEINRLIAGLDELIARTVGPEIEVESVAAAGLWTTLVDGNQLENAILNLCINARDAMPNGGRLTIETANRWLDGPIARERGLEPGQFVAISVTDTGTGMSPEVIGKAFDPFFTTKPIGAGTGLGLSMIYGFTRQSGGQTRIYSEVGQGTTVTLYLPRHFGQAEEQSHGIGEVDLPRGAGETVLVVDDEPTVRMLVAETLEELGYQAVEAADGASGLAILQSDLRIDLLVTDVGLPGGMNGRQMADQARISRPDLQILFITGYAENAVVGNGHLAAGMHVMTKPFAMDALAARIKDLIANR
ncbi:PAS domain S-box-containing protein [Sphingomonas jejuensis]|uniref:histidine kinase n=2 Tax=Sphingomonas jejuensis TaxID=904715 RepID=A0ABX0XHY0_9SPHN|nr:PAS domain S-box-containing protein [Sphingomonas jejuensis]